LAKFNAEERYAYQDSVKYYRDLKNSLDTAREEGEAFGEAKGRQAEKLEVVNAALAEGLPLNVIVKLTGLSEAEIMRLKRSE
jgi:predicted transposase/invertase (TIGR01784 family)